ncbi:MAG: mechanosensitive ion channel domain-containing protein [Pseudomonadota bacterium]
MPRLCRALCLLVVLALFGAAGAGDVRAQTLPIPGLPGGLGGITTPEADPPADGSAEASPPGDAPVPADAESPAQVLIEILRDDAAREALIQELEAASSRAAEPEAAPEDAPQAGGIDDASDEDIETFGDRTIAATRAVGGAIYFELENAWLRLQRIPTTFALSTRIFEDGELEKGLREIASPALFVYGVFILLRLLIRPLRKGIASAARRIRWFRKLLLRVLASALDLATIPLALIIGVTVLVVLGFGTTGPNDEVQLTDPQALFLSAFATIETFRVALRFVLSPNTESLRILRFPNDGARSVWIFGSVIAYVLGYGQLMIVPVISNGISVFVGRAAAAVLSAIVVSILIAYVLRHRTHVSDWLCGPSADKGLVGLVRPLFLRWHWPVLAYLAYVFVAVLTRPGNVLLPLLQTTSEAALVIVVASMVMTALSARAALRARVPKAIAERLPLLEERINQIRPAFLAILRFFVLLITLLVLLNVLGIQGIGGFLSGAVLEQFSSGLFSVLLITALLALVWLAMTSWVDYRLNPFVGSVPTSREVTLLTLMKNAVTVAIIIVGIITSLAQLGMNVGPLIASAGVIGLAISFGAQRMVEDIFSGIFIQAENAMNVGDVVDVGGTVGTVEKLTVRSVTLRDLSGVVHVIPFSSAAKISNYMRDFAYHVADIGVAYREDVDDVRLAMHDAFDKLRADPDLEPHIIGDLEWFGLNAFGPSELVMRARIKTVPGQQWGIGRAYNAIVKAIFDERGIEIPFPHQTLYFGEDKAGAAPPLNLRVQRPGRAPMPDRADPGGPPRDDRIRGADHPDADGDAPPAMPREDRIVGADLPDEDGR